MILDRYRIIEHTFPMKTAYKTQRLNLETRHFCKLVLSSSKIKEVGIGEIAPLPGFSNSTLQKEIFHANHRLPDIFPFRLSGNILEDFYLVKNFELSNHVTFAFEQAILNFYANRNAREIKLIDTKRKVVSTSCLLYNFSRENIQTLRRHGYKSFKIKAIRNTDLFFLALDRLKEHECNIRVDVNGMWNNHEVKKNLIRLREYPIEFIEDISLNLNEVVNIQKNTRIPLAVDEPLTTLNELSFLCNHGIKFFILKPARLGGILNTISFIREGRKKSVYIIISHSFESTCGNNTLIFLSNHVDDHLYSHGICLDYI